MRSRPYLRIAAASLAILLLVAACSRATDEDESTTTVPTGTAAAGTEAPTSSATPPTTKASAATTTTTTAPTTTTTSPTTTTTARPTTTTTTSTLAIPPDNKPPTVEIISPSNLSSHIAVLDSSGQRFGAAVSLSAVVSDPNGDDVTVQWFSNDEGALGTGDSIVAIVHTGQSDSAQPVITARATDQWGATNEASVQIIVWIPSDV